jgi:hypothetical protein
MWECGRLRKPRDICRLRRQSGPPEIVRAESKWRRGSAGSWQQQRFWWLVLFELVAKDQDVGRGLDPQANSIPGNSDHGHNDRIAEPDTFLFSSR